MNNLPRQVGFRANDEFLSRLDAALAKANMPDRSHVLRTMCEAFINYVETYGEYYPFELVPKQPPKPSRSKGE